MIVFIGGETMTVRDVVNETSTCSLMLDL